MKIPRAKITHQGHLLWGGIRVSSLIPESSSVIGWEESWANSLSDAAVDSKVWQPEDVYQLPFAVGSFEGLSKQYTSLVITV